MIETNSPLSPRIKTYQVVSETVPEFAVSENPAFVEFLKQYYISQDYQGGPSDIAENIDAYIKLDNLTTDVIRGTTSLTADISDSADVINVTNTDGYPQQNGLLRIDNEIITYSEKTSTSFIGCIRGFSGISGYSENAVTWRQTVASSHSSGASVVNVSVLFLQEFYKKLKTMYAPGLEGVTLSPDLNVNNFIKEARSLYEAKGTEDSFKILFKALFGIEPKINDLEKYLIKPSYANYVRRKTISVELISGDPAGLIGETLFQDNDPNNSNYNAASGPISEVTNIRDNYYKISLFTGFDDRSLTDGTFRVAGRTRNIGEIGIGATVITVDSTIGFSSVGSLKIGDPANSYYQTLSYSTKSINQFFGVNPAVSTTIPDNSKISAPNVVYGYEQGDTSKQVVMRVTGALSKFNSNQSLQNLDANSSIRVKNLGRYIDNPENDKSYEEIFFNSWIYNTSARYYIDTFSGSNFVLEGTIDKSSLRKNDRVQILKRGTTELIADNLVVTAVNVVTSTISLSGTIPTLDPLSLYDVRRKQKKAVSTVVPLVGGQEQLLTDVNNTYIVSENESESGKREGFVASSSLPSYPITTDKIRAKLINPSLALGNWQGYSSVENAYSIISFTNPVPFKTGEQIYYAAGPGTTAIGGLEQKDYYVKVLSSPNQIQLFASRAFIKADLPVYFTPPTQATGTHDFILSSQGNRSLFPARPIRRFILEQDLKSGKEQRTTSEVTSDGNTGMLINGVEILNYKTSDVIYYGEIESVDILSGGSGYDVLYPPSITINDSNVSAANTAGALAVVSGKIENIVVDPVTFDIDSVVSVEIWGGNGTGARGRAVTEERYREIAFSGISTLSGGDVNATNDVFTFDDDHNLLTGARIVYDANGNSNLGIATTGSSKEELTLMSGQDYYVHANSDNSISLYYTKNDAILGISSIQISEDAAAANTGLHIFRTYEQKTAIGRVSIEDPGEGYTNRHLIVKTVGVNTSRDYIEFKNHGFSSGEVINYTYDTTGITGLSSAKQYQVIKLDDNRFRLAEAGNKGDVEPTTTNYDKGIHQFLDSSGSGYQRFYYPEIQCRITVLTEDQKERQLTATPIVRGEVVETIIYEKGSGYGSEIINFENPPTVSIPKGSLAQIGIIINNGKIISAFVLAGGSGYSGPPDIIVESTTVGAGGGVLRAESANGAVTSVKIISAGGGYESATTSVRVSAPGNNLKLRTSLRSIALNKAYGLNPTQLTYLSPVPSGLAVNYIGYGNSIRNFFGDDGSGHSPIIGWAYDGNPIYGPFGLEDPNNIQSDVKRMESSYEIVSTNISNRPPVSTYPYGSFIKDYVYTGSGDLDEHNGRFTKTPEFPDGVYAYFATVDNLFAPQFPYFIGNTYRSSALLENTVVGLLNDQVNFDFVNSKLVRNTFPYNLFGDGKAYDYVFQPYNENNQVSTPDKLGVGSITSIDVLASGSGYSVKDQIVFDETTTNGGGLSAEVQKIYGKTVDKVTSNVTIFNTVPMEYGRNGIVFNVTPYHEFQTNDTVGITGISTFIKGLEGYNKIDAPLYKTTLTDSGYTGIITDLRVDYVPTVVSAGDSIGIGTEIMRVLNIFPSEKIVRVERYAGFTTSSAGAAVTYFNSKFTIPLTEIPLFESRFQDIYYFNPKEAVGVGTTVGFSTSVNVSLNGVTKTRSILSRSIFLEDHSLKNNDLVTFDTRGNSDIFATDSISPYTTPSALSGNYYVVRKTKNTIGIKTIPEGPELFFTSTGDNQANYSFTTNYNQETARVERSVLTVVANENHDLSVGDNVSLTVRPGLATGIGASTTAVIKLLDGQLIVNPIGIPTTGINTSTNIFTVNDHGLDTGFKVLMYGAAGVSTALPDGLEQRTYFVLKVDNDQFQLTNSKQQLLLDPPEVVSVNDFGVDGQTLNPINPPIKVTRRNDLVFNLNDTTLSGSKLKIFYDNNYFNEYVGTGTTDNLEIVGVGTVGIGTTNPPDDPTKTIVFNRLLRNELYYALEVGGYISTADRDVADRTKIIYVDSAFNGNYTISGVGSTTFEATLVNEPETSEYLSADCDELFYTTTAIGATGGIAKVRINNNGFGYQAFPDVVSIGNSGVSAELKLNGKDINRLESVTVPTDVYGYPSDNTLKPDAFLPRVVKIKNADKVIEADVTFGGRSYLNAPSLSLYDLTTGEIVNNGLITCELSDSAVNSVEVVVQPRGLTNNNYGLAPLRNSNGISIIEAFSDVGVLTCKITTPILGYVDEPFSTGEIVYLEGIEFNNDGDGFNSGDYKFTDFEIADYNSAVNPRQVTFTYAGFTTNVGTGATVQPGFGQIVKSTDLARFTVTKKFSEFSQNETLKRNDDLQTDLIMRSINTATGEMVIEGSRPLEPDDQLVGTNSGDRAEVDVVQEFDGYFDISATIDTNLGWSDNVGLIGDNNQFLPDNDYYQNMSYAIESEKTYDDIVTYVNNIAHPAGMKNFANTQVLSVGDAGDSIRPADDAGGFVLDFISDPLRVDAVYGFDLARDVDAADNVSKFVELRSTRLSDFILNKTNRVLVHDDISPQFVSNESNDLSDDRTIAAAVAGRQFSRYLVQTTHAAENPINNQYQFNELIMVVSNQNTYLLQKSHVNNNNNAGLSTGYAEYFSFFNVNDNQTELRIKPYETFDTDYDIKCLQQGFASDVGIGSTNTGNVVNTSVNLLVGTATTATIVGFATTTFVGGIGHFLVVDKATNKIDYHELALQTDGVDTYLTELASFNTRQSLGGLSAPTFMGTFTSNIESGVVKIDYIHSNLDAVDVRCKFISFENVGLGTTSVRHFNLEFTPEGTERSARIVVGSSATTGIATVVGVSSNIDLSFKSTVHVSYGSTQTLHQIYVLSDPEKQDTYLSQAPIAAVGTTTGIGTFGAEFSAGKVNLEFYPDAGVSGMVSIFSYNEIVYKDLDPNGSLAGIGSFDYGKVFENVTQNSYLGINNRNIREFDLTYQGVPIYERDLNPQNPNQINYGTGLISFQHFFSNTEQVTYTPDSNIIGIAASALHYVTGYGSTELPSTVYIVKNNNSQFFISTSLTDARAGLAITFQPGSGSGNKHRFTMEKRDQKTIVALSGIVQKPITYTQITYDLDAPVNGIVTSLALSGLSTVTSGDLLKLEDEYTIVKTVGFATTSTGPITGIGTWSIAEVERGAVGTAATDHAAGTTGRIHRGAFQILNSKIHFTDAPLGGDLGISDPSNLPYPRATFGGRTYLRVDYDTNELFDDFSDQFDGLENTFSLTAIGAAVTGIGTTGGNGVLFVNGIFQAPFGENNEGISNFKIIEDPVSSAASVQFTGITSVGFTDLIIDEDDINQNQLPRGGIIISVASTPGLGYAPFEGASVRLEVGTGGTITNIIGVSTAGPSVNVTEAFYDNKTGIMTVTTATPHGLLLEDQVKLVGLAFTCPGYGATYSVYDFQYDESTGIATVFTVGDHGLTAGDDVKLAYIGFSCTAPHAGVTTTIFPDGTQGYFYPVNSVGTTTSFVTNVGISTIAHTYAGGGQVQTGITTNIFPDHDDPFAVIGFISATQFKTNVGPSTFGHTYVSGGTAAQWHPLTFGSGYRTGIGTIGIAVTSSTGTGATITAVVGAGGSLVFSVVGPGTNYTADDLILPPEPNGENLNIIGLSRIGLGATTVTGVGCSISVEIAGVSTATGIGSTYYEVAKWEFSKKGYGFKRGDIFTVAGLSTDPAAGDNFKDFEIEVIDVFTDQVAAWQFGNIDYLDNIKRYQNGDQKRFILEYQRSIVSFEIDRNDADSKEIDLSAVLLIFINGVIQQPGVNYSFTGGSVLEFTTAPTPEDNVVIFFYRGTIGQDSFLFDVNEVIKVGDEVKLEKSAEVELNTVTQTVDNFAQDENRIVKRIDSAVTVETPFYQGVGISNDNYKPLTWIKQKKDILIDGSVVSKARDSIEAQISPIASVIGVVSTTDAFLFVDSVALFKDTDDSLTENFNLAFIAEVGFGTTAVSGINYEDMTGINPLVANVQGYIGVVTGISTCPGIGTDLALLIQFDVQEYVNDGNDPTGLGTNYPFRLYGTGINTAGIAITSIDTHDSDVVGTSTYYGDGIYYASAISFVTGSGSRLGIITANIASYTDTTGFVGVGSTAFPYAYFSWGRFGEVDRAANAVYANVKGLNYDPQLSQYPIVQRRGVGLRGTGGLPKRL